MLLLWTRVDLGAMAMKGCSTFPKSPASLEPHHQIFLVSYPGHSFGGVLPLCRGAVSVFYSPSQLGKEKISWKGKEIEKEENKVMQRRGKFEVYQCYISHNSHGRPHSVVANVLHCDINYDVTVHLISHYTTRTLSTLG